MDGTKAFLPKPKRFADDVPERGQIEGLISYPHTVKEEQKEEFKHQVLLVLPI